MLNAGSKKARNISSRVHRSSLSGRGMIRRQYRRMQESTSGKNKDIIASWEQLNSSQRWRQTVLEVQKTKNISRFRGCACPQSCHVVLHAGQFYRLERKSDISMKQGPPLISRMAIRGKRLSGTIVVTATSPSTDRTFTRNAITPRLYA